MVIRLTPHPNLISSNAFVAVKEKDEDLATYVAEAVWDRLKVGDPWEAVRGYAKQEVDALIHGMKKY